MDILFNFSDHLNHVRFCFLAPVFAEMHNECIMNNDHDDPADSFQHRISYNTVS